MTRFREKFSRGMDHIYVHRFMPLYMVLLAYLSYINAVYFITDPTFGFHMINLFVAGLCAISTVTTYRSMTRPFKGWNGYLTYAWGARVEIDLDHVVKMMGKMSVADEKTYENYTKFIEGKISKWATENNIKHWVIRWNIDATLTFVFRRKVDAVAFKLEWI